MSWAAFNTAVVVTDPSDLVTGEQDAESEASRAHGNDPRGRGQAGLQLLVQRRHRAVARGGTEGRRATAASNVQSVTDRRDPLTDSQRRGHRYEPRE